MRAFRLILVISACLFASTIGHAAEAQSGKKPSRAPVAESVTPSARHDLQTAPPGPQPVDPDLIQLWTFDDALGNPVPQGWSKVDLTSQATFVHVDSYNAIGAPRSLWFGIQPTCSTPELCAYATLPGYGNDWDQRWQSQSLTVTGTNNITVSFDLKYDTEPTYDIFYLDYITASGTYHVASWSGNGTESVTKTIPVGSFTSPIRIRLRFKSDSAFSDEDGQYPSNGAVFVDNLVVKDGTTVKESLDFTAEAQGATQSANGHWFGGAGPAFGQYAGLFDGDAVLQQDPNYTNSTNLWGFFTGSPENYTCGGFPAQTVIKHGSVTQLADNYIRDEIQSPSVSIAGIPAGQPVMLNYDVYGDNPTDNLMYWRYRVRGLVAGTWSRWQSNGVVYNDPSKTWTHRMHNIRPQIPAGATDIQVAIGVIDMCPYWCGIYGTGTCHSHAPLIDNVSVSRGNTSTGSLVNVQPWDPTTDTSPVTLTFNSVTQAGVTSLVTGPSGPTLPGNFMTGNGIYYNLSTTATYTSPIKVCINYSEATLTVPESTLRLLHWDTSLIPAQWVDITWSLDTTNNILCGYTNSLSPFVIGAGSVTAVGDGTQPHAFALRQNVPNPFNPITTISYDVPAGGARVSLRIYDTAGRLVRTLVDEQRPAGTHNATWDGRNAAGSAVSSGVYFYRMVSGSFSESRRMVLLK